MSRTLRARGWLPTLGRWVEAIRPGQWAAVVAVPLACGALVRQVGTADEAARRLAIAIGMLAAGVAAVQWLDAGQPVAGVWSRALPLLPFVALAIARLCRAILARTSDGDQRTRAAAVLMMVAFAVTAEGLSRHLLLEYQGLVSTPYGSYVASVRRYVPPGVRVLGPPRLALGFSTSDYRSWTAPLADSDPRGPAPVSLTSVLDRVAPDVILMDAGPQSLVRSDDGDPRGPALRQWLRDHRFGERSLVFDRTYGTLRVYRR